VRNKLVPFLPLPSTYCRCF